MFINWYAAKADNPRNATIHMALRNFVRRVRICDMPWTFEFSPCSRSLLVSDGMFPGTSCKHSYNEFVFWNFGIYYTIGKIFPTWY